MLINATDWLRAWTERDHKGVTAADVVICRAEADQAGITSTALDAAAGGDLEAYLLNVQDRLAARANPSNEARAQ